jgi:membrane-associated protein
VSAGLAYLIDFAMHLDTHLAELVAAYGPWVYAILFLIVFAETGLVVTPFLPGDSLLFATGAIAATGALDPLRVVAVLVAAAVLGDAANYWIGHFVGPRVFTRARSWFFNPEHLHRTHAFYERHGGKTIIIARFVPIIRTFAPFVAGIGDMTYRHFFAYNVVGALLWVPTLVYAGHAFGNLPLVRRNFSLVIAAIIVISVIPMAVEVVRHRWGRRARPAA